MTSFFWKFAHLFNMVILKQFESIIYLDIHQMHSQSMIN